MSLVHYETGRREIRGITLLQAVADPTAYYYLPTAPRLALGDDGAPKLLALKYVDGRGGSTGGLFHAMVELTLVPEDVEALADELATQVPGARLLGPVRLLPAAPGDEGEASFRVVSAVLSDTEELTRSVVTSGAAPVTPGSQAVVSARLTAPGATLLWDSLRGPTSDVSVAVSAFYEARVPAWGARVTAAGEVVYTHVSQVSNVQHGFTRRQLRDAVDELHRTGGLDVEVFDRGALESSGGMEALLSLVTDKLTEWMFDAETGWARDPDPEPTVEPGQLAGRQKQGFLSRLFRGPKDLAWISEDQLVLKNLEDVRRRTFTLNLERATTLRVPVHLAGNLSGSFDALGDDPAHFRVVDLEDPDFEIRTVHVGLDGAYLAAFEDTLDAVSVEVRRGDRTRSLLFSHEDVTAGRLLQEISFPRLGAEGTDWTRLDLRVTWALRGREDLTVPAEPGAFVETSDAALSLAPPFARRDVEIDVDRSDLEAAGVRRVVIRLAAILGGRPTTSRTVVLRPDALDAPRRVAVYHDPDQPVAYRVAWITADGVQDGALTLLEDDYLFLIPPADVSAVEEPLEAAS